MQSQVTSEATYQKLRYQKLCLKTSCSDTCRESRFVRRTLSATMIEFHHLLTTQKLENQPYLSIMTLVLLYELITGFGRIFITKIDRTQRLLDMVKDCTISSWRNLTASNSNSRRSTLYYK
ncbi:hypothetical protein QL285_045738 [Trifolium repens]|nr:hypothetical protein QL285_045738 [Trifolium repens]